MSAPEVESTIEPPSRKPFSKHAKEGEIIEPISLEESKRLIELEACIKQHIVSFMIAGEALAEIRDRRLYRIEHATFEDYCRVKWKMSDRRARQLMDAVSVVDNVGKSGTVVPISERQVRPLTKLKPEQQPAAWGRAVEIANGEQPSSKQVEKATREVVSIGEDKAFKTRLREENARRREIERTRKAGKELSRAWLRSTEEQRKRILAETLRGPRMGSGMCRWIRDELINIAEENREALEDDERATISLHDVPPAPLPASIAMQQVKAALAAIEMIPNDDRGKRDAIAWLRDWLADWLGRSQEGAG